MITNSVNENDAILRLENITKIFPGVTALDEVSFEIKRGEVHVLIGENGAGKSTLMKILSGVYKQDKGRIIFDGDEVVFNNPKEAQKSGISIIFQEFSLIPYLNAAENIFLGKELTKKGFLNKKQMTEEAGKLLNELGVNIDLEAPVNKLSVAEQQFIEIVKAISINAKVLILDEPTATLTNKEIKTLFKMIANLKAKNVTMIYISHHLEEAFEIGDRMSCLRDGKYVATKTMAELTKEEIIRMMVGREIADTYPERKTELPPNDFVLEVKNLQRRNYQNQLNFRLKRGEILGLAGLVGSGRTEMIRAVIGADKVTSKEVYLNGNRVKINSPQEALAHGIGLIPEDRKNQGLVLGLSVGHNISLASLPKFVVGVGLIERKREQKSIAARIRELGIKTVDDAVPVKSLSGGNQQKVVLGKWLNTDCKVLIFDEPTRGIDVGAKAEIYKLMRELTESGISIIMISSELSEVIGMSDRILVMCQGRIITEMPAETATQEKIMFYSTGGEDIA
jgi:ribose transport system ATP-binding protein